MKIFVKVIPWSKVEKIEYIWKDPKTNIDIYKIKTSSPPIKWKANEKVIKLISQEFQVSKNKIKIISWKTSTTKIIEF